MTLSLWHLLLRIGLCWRAGFCHRLRLKVTLALGPSSGILTCGPLCTSGHLPGFVTCCLACVTAPTWWPIWGYAQLDSLFTNLSCNTLHQSVTALPPQTLNPACQVSHVWIHSFHLFFFSFSAFNSPFPFKRCPLPLTFPPLLITPLFIKMSRDGLHNWQEMMV